MGLGADWFVSSWVIVVSGLLLGLGSLVHGWLESMVPGAWCGDEDVGSSPPPPEPARLDQTARGGKVPNRPHLFWVCVCVGGARSVSRNCLSALYIQLNF